MQLYRSRMAQQLDKLYLTHIVCQSLFTYSIAYWNVPYLGSPWSFQVSLYLPIRLSLFRCFKLNHRCNNGLPFFYLTYPVHIVPRRPRDLPFNDDIYVLLDKFELQLSELQLKSQSKHDISSIDQLNSSNTVQSAKNLEIQCDAPDEQRINATELDPAENETESGKSDRRVPRSQDAMAREAQFLRKRLFELGYEGLGLGKKEKWSRQENPIQTWTHFKSFNRINQDKNEFA